MREYRMSQALQYRYSQIKTQAKRRNYSFELTFEQFLDIVNKPCHYCGSTESKFNGVDRKDNTIGYSYNNSLTCCKHCNWSKRARTYEDFINWIHTASKNLIKSCKPVEPIPSELTSNI